MLLAKTAEAISEFSASVPDSFGQHFSSEVSSTRPGLIIGETPYSDKHSPQQIKPNSIMGIATGLPFVNVTIPHRPFSVNVIEYRDPSEQILDEQNDPRLRVISVGRQMLSRSLADALIDPEYPEDECIHYLVGQPASSDEANRELEVVQDTEELPEAIEAIFDIARSGLTFVISNMNWPAKLLEGRQATSLVGIKANYLTDRQLQADTGVWRTGHPDMPEVDTSNKDQLAIWNEYLNRLHISRLSRLEAVGIVTASVVFDPRIKSPYVSVRAVDNEISAAVKKVDRIIGD